MSESGPTLQTLAGQLQAFGARPAVGLREDLGLRWWSYERLHYGAHRAAALLRDAGVGKGDRVVIRGRNCPEWVAYFFGTMLRGAVIVPVDHDSPPELVRRIAGLVDAKFIVENLYDLYPFSNETVEPIPVAPSDPAVIFYTSGTTADPRGIELTHANVMAQAGGFPVIRRPARRFGSRMLVMAPLSHAQGLVLGVAIPLSLGLSVIYTHLTHAGHLIRTIRDNRVVAFSTVPRVLHTLGRVLQSQKYAGKDAETLGDKIRGRRWLLRRHYTFTHLRRKLGYRFWIVLVGGAPLPREDEDFWRVSGFLLVQGYGLTEATAIVSINAPLFGTFGSVGKPRGGQEIRLAEDGEILVRGPNVMAESDGEYLRTGDIGRLDRRNRLFVLGRKKDVIVTGEGFNVHGSDVEALFNACPEVEDSVVVGLEHDGHTEVHAALLMRDGADASGVVARVNQQLLEHQRVRSWTLWPEADFPRTNLLKPRRGVIAEAIARREPPPSGDDTPPETLDDVLRIEDKQKRIGALARYIGRAGADDSSIVRELGLSSLDTVELIALLEAQSGAELERVALNDATTVSELHRVMETVERQLRPLDEPDSPRWPARRVFPWIRRVLNPLVLNTMVRLRTRLLVSGLEHLEGIDGPVIYAGAGHEHAFDVLLLHRALPARLRRKLAVVASRWVFTHYLDPVPETTWMQRAAVGLGFHFLFPLFFPFVLSAHWARSRETLMEACWLVDRGYSLIAFDGKGMGVVARQCGVPIVPVRIGNPERAGWRPTLRRAETSITFEAPLRTDPAISDDELTRTLEAFYHRDPSPPPHGGEGAEGG